MTFINKMDREARSPFDLLDEIEKTLALDTAPVTWPISQGRSFAGTYDLRRDLVRRIDTDEEPMKVSGPARSGCRPPCCRPRSARPGRTRSALAQEACKPFDLEAFREGHLTPVFFGSALRNFGVRDLIDAMAAYAPPPRGQESDKRLVEAGEPKMTGFVFKIQANMDPNHRDRIAFMRICSGKLSRGMKAKLVRTGKPMSLNAPQFFFAQDRAIADEAWAGDVVGLPNHGTLRIGDTLTEGEDIVFRGVPSFAPEIMRRIKLQDAMKAKKLREALQQMAEEGVVQLFVPQDGSGAIVGVVGALAARRAEGAADGRIQSADRLRAHALHDLPLDRIRTTGRTRQIHRLPPVVHGARSRRRPGLHGGQQFQSSIRDGPRKGHHLLGRQGLSEEGCADRRVLGMRLRETVTQAQRPQDLILVRDESALAVNACGETVGSIASERTSSGRDWCSSPTIATTSLRGRGNATRLISIVAAQIRKRRENAFDQRAMRAIEKLAGKSRIGEAWRQEKKRVAHGVLSAFR